MSLMDVLRYSDFRYLYATNIAEFAAATLVKLGILQWLYEATGSGMALGGLGIVQLITTVPSVLVGGVLADMVDRKRLVTCSMAMCGVVAASLCFLAAVEALVPAYAYTAVAVFSVSRRLEASARASLLGVVVPVEVVPAAASLMVLTENAGELAAPLLFAAVSAIPSLSPTFGIGAFLYVIAACLPRGIRAPGLAEGASMKTLSIRGGWESMVAGLVYIMRHPLLPGLYALDWGMTLFTYYRELFPFLIASLWVDMRMSLSPRSAAAALTMANYAGSMGGSALTLGMTKYPHKGRGVAYATLLYGVCCMLMGCSSSLLVGLFSVAACGATDAVGVTMRKTVVLLTTSDEMRGRASAGHSLAATSANALGLLYVAAAGTVIGSGPTFILGGALTWLAVGLAIWKIPQIWTYTGRAADAALGSSTSEMPPVDGSKVGKSTVDTTPVAPTASSCASSATTPKARLLNDDSAKAGAHDVVR